MPTYLQPPTFCASKAHNLSFLTIPSSSKNNVQVARGKKNVLKSETNFVFQIELTVLQGNKTC